MWLCEWEIHLAAVTYNYCILDQWGIVGEEHITAHSNRRKHPSRGGEYLNVEVMKSSITFECLAMNGAKGSYMNTLHSLWHNKLPPPPPPLDCMLNLLYCADYINTASHSNVSNVATESTYTYYVSSSALKTLLSHCNIIWNVDPSLIKIFMVPWEVCIERDWLDCVHNWKQRLLSAHTHTWILASVPLVHPWPISSDNSWGIWMMGQDHCAKKQTFLFE